MQLNVDHRLITPGPFAVARHPLYLGVLTARLGGLLIYRTWTFVLVVTNVLPLVHRTWREEQALAAEFGQQWEAYCRRVPAWIPGFWRGLRKG